MEIKKIRFTVRQEDKDRWNVMMETDDREVLCGQFPNQYQADRAAEEAQKRFDAAKVREKQFKRYKITLPSKEQMQAVAMGLDPMRAAKFREQLIFLNYSLFMMTDSFDQTEDLFSPVVNKSIAQHYKIASKHIEALLEAVYQSGLIGSNADDYTEVAKAAYALKERFELITSYVGLDEWRLMELDKTISNILPEEFVTKERMRIGKEMRELLENNTHGERCEIVEKGGKA